MRRSCSTPQRRSTRPFGLGAAGGDEGDAELLERASELSGIALADQLFLDRPGVVVAHEDAAAIAVESQGDVVAAQQLAEQAERAESRFGGEELGGEDLAGGVVLQAESGEPGATALEPVMRRAIELNQFACAGSPSRPGAGDDGESPG